MADLDELLLPATVAVWDDFQMGVAITLDLPTTSWRPQTPERVVIYANAQSLESASVGIAYEAIRGGFLAYGRGEWLSIHALDVYNTPRNEATFATAPGQFTSTSNVPYTVPAGDSISVKKSGTDITYRVPGPYVVPANGSVSSGIVAVCDVAGSDGNAGAGDIDEVVDGLPGVSFTNTGVAVANDRETDDALRERAGLATAPTSPAGPADAYRYVATTASGTDGEKFYPDPAKRALIDTTRVAAVVTTSTGIVDVYYANTAGVVSGPTLAAINEAILKWVVPIGVPYNGHSATPVVTDVTFLAYYDASSGLEPSEVQAAAEASVASWFPTLDIHGLPTPGDEIPGVYGLLPIDKIKGRIVETEIGGQRPIYKVTLMTPAADVNYAVGQVPALGINVGSAIAE
jgi:hypothetical protein